VSPSLSEQITLNKTFKKEQCEFICHKWTEHWKTNPWEKTLHLQFYPLDGTKLLLTCDADYADCFKLKEWVLSQPETDEFEWQQHKYYPKGKDPKEIKAAADAKSAAAAGGGGAGGAAAAGATATATGAGAAPTSAAAAAAAAPTANPMEVTPAMMAKAMATLAANPVK
jgi:hypothetical protein